MINRFKNMVFILPVFIILITGCRSNGETESTAELKEASLSETEDSRVAVEAMVLIKESVKQNVPLTGILEPVHAVDLISEVSGEVTSILKELGQWVTPEDTLAIVDDVVAYSQFKQAQSHVLSAKNNLDIAKLNLKSDEELFNQADISKLEFENSRLSAKSAEANYLGALAQFKIAEKNYQETRITSPVQGSVSRKHVDLGTMVNPGTMVYRVVDISKLKVIVGVPQGSIKRVKVGGLAILTVDALDGKQFEGMVQYVSPQADENTGSFSVEIHVKNTASLEILAGMTTRIELVLTSLEEQLVIPDYALVKKNDNNYIYRIQNRQALLTPIQIGAQYGNQLIVEKGAVLGDTVVVVGMKNLGVSTPIWIEQIQ